MLTLSRSTFPPREILVGRADGISCTVGGPLDITKIKLVGESASHRYNKIRHATRFDVVEPDKFLLLHWD